MKLTIITVALLTLVCGLWSCNKKTNETCVAGAGGNILLVAYPKHHNKLVRPYSVWLKFNASNQPGNTEAAYDIVVPADTTEDHVHIPNLKCGNYYVYMTGFDIAGPYKVVGGIPFTIPQNASGEISIDVPVKE